MTTMAFAGKSAQLHNEQRSPTEFRSIRVHNFYAYKGGEDRTLASEVALLRSRGHVVAEFYARNDPAGPARNLGAAVGAIWNREARRRLIDFIDLHDPTIVHCTVMPRPHSSRLRHIMPAASGWADPSAQHIHNYRKLFRTCRHVIP